MHKGITNKTKKRKLDAAHALAASGAIPFGAIEIDSEGNVFFDASGMELGAAARFPGTTGLFPVPPLCGRDESLAFHVRETLDEAKRLKLLPGTNEKTEKDPVVVSPLAWFFMNSDGLLAEAENGKTILENSFEEFCGRLGKAGVIPLERIRGDGGASMASWGPGNGFLVRVVRMSRGSVLDGNFEECGIERQETPESFSATLGTFDKYGEPRNRRIEFRSSAECDDFAEKKLREGFVVSEEGARTEIPEELISSSLFGAAKHFSVLCLELFLSGRKVPPLVELHAERLMEFFESLEHLEKYVMTAPVSFLKVRFHMSPAGRSADTLAKAAARSISGALSAAHPSVGHASLVAAAAERFERALATASPEAAFFREEAERELGEDGFGGLREKIEIVVAGMAGTDMLSDGDVPAL